MVFSTVGEYHKCCVGYHQYIRGCSVLEGDIICAVDGYHSVPWIVFSTVGNIIITVGDTISLRRIFSTIGDTNQYYGGIPSVQGAPTVLWMVFSDVGEYQQYCGGNVGGKVMLMISSDNY